MKGDQLLQKVEQPDSNRNGTSEEGWDLGGGVDKKGGLIKLGRG